MTPEWAVDLPHVSGTGLTAVVDSNRGAKVVALLDHTGQSWLSGPPDPYPAPGRPGTSFVEGDMFGWDECAPTVTATVLPDGRALPDHGDLWDVAWSVQHNDPAGNLATTVTGRCLPYQLTRRIQSTATGLRFSYEVVADESNLPFLWLAHPQFRAPTGTRVLLEADRVVEVLGKDPVPQPWTEATDGIDSVPPGGCRKVYVEPDHSVGEIGLSVPGRGVLKMRWDPVDLPYLGVWFDRCRYAREDVIALEPSNGYYDSLSTALACDRARRLAVGTPTGWYLDLSLEEPNSATTT